ncbi:MAG: CHASE domain-containing protein [Candidatus Accumulibacter sp. UW20]|jgi:CHASE1-domain containing sensor protein
MLENLRKYTAAYAVAIGGIVLTCLSSWNVQQELETSHFKEFEWAAGDRIQAVRSTVDQGLDALLEIRGLFHDTRGVDEAAFVAFTDSVLKRRPYIDNLLWASVLTSSARATSSKEVAPHGELRVQVMLSASRTGFNIAPGVDLNAAGELAALFERARASGKVAVSGRLELVRPGETGGAAQVIYAALPVYAPHDPRRARPAGRRAEPLGFVVAIYDIEQLIDVAISLLEPRGVEVLVRDDSAAGDAQLSPFLRQSPDTARGTDARRPVAESRRGATARSPIRIPVGDRELDDHLRCHPDLSQCRSVHQGALVSPARRYTVSPPC